MPVPMSAMVVSQIAAVCMFFSSLVFPDFYYFVDLCVYILIFNWCAKLLILEVKTKKSTPNKDFLEQSKEI